MSKLSKDGDTFEGSTSVPGDVDSQTDSLAQAAGNPNADTIPTQQVSLLMTSSL